MKTGGQDENPAPCFFPFFRGLQ